MKYIAIIPAYNPGIIVKEVVYKTLDYVDLVILVDDGCDAQHKYIFFDFEKHPKVKVLRHEENMGKGRALWTGFLASLDFNYDYVITLDSDGQHLPEQVEIFKKHIESSNKYFDFIIGEREIGKNMPWRSNIGNSITGGIFRFFWRSGILDTQSGFRALSNSFIKKIIYDIKPGRYETEMRILIKALRDGHNVGSVKISTVYFDNNKNSKFNPVSDSFKVLKQFLLFAILGFSDWVLDYSIFILLSLSFSVFFLWAHITSKVISVIYYFYVNKYIVFNSYRHGLYEFLRYLLVVSFNILITSSLLYLLVSYFQFSQFMAKPLVDVLMFTANFFILKSFVYSKK